MLAQLTVPLLVDVVKALVQAFQIDLLLPFVSDHDLSLALLRSLSH